MAEVPTSGAMAALAVLAEVGEGTVTVARLMYDMDCSRNTARSRLRECAEAGLVEVWDREGVNGVTLAKGFRITPAGRDALGLAPGEGAPGTPAPCPLCGAPAEVASPAAAGPFAVSCTACGLRLEGAEADEVVERWNARIAPEGGR